jgi:hypothetical protein
MQLAIIIPRTSCKTKVQQLDTGMQTQRRLSPSGASHFTSIPVRSYQSSIVSSRPGPTLRSAASAMMKFDTHLLFVGVHLDANDDTVTSSTFQTTLVAVSYLSDIHKGIGQTIVVPDAFRSCLSPPEIWFPLECAACHPQR